jgi:hypothetical protein
MPKPTREPLFDASDPADALPNSTIWIDQTKCWLSPRIALHCWDTTEHEGKSSGSANQFVANNIARPESNMYLSAQFDRSWVGYEVERRGNRCHTDFGSWPER